MEDIQYPRKRPDIFIEDPEENILKLTKKEQIDAKRKFEEQLKMK